MDRLHHGVRHVQPRQVQELERTHAEAGTVAKDRVEHGHLARIDNTLRPGGCQPRQRLPAVGAGDVAVAVGRQLPVHDLLLGDGAAGFSLMDIDTLVRHKLPVVMVVGNNGIWGLEKHPMQFLYQYDVAAELQPGTRYDDVAKALGADGETVDQVVTITINGTEDAPVIAGTSTGTVKEDTTLSASGTLKITDTDTGEAVFQAQALHSTGYYVCNYRCICS